MTRDELEKRNVGENLDALMNLDPRGYGVCRILYAGSRAFTGEPLTMHAAQVLCDSVKENDLVYILVGFVLLPHKVPEMDGTVSAMLLARALVMAFNAKPVIVCPADSVQAIEKCAAVVGLHIYEDLDTVQECYGWGFMQFFDPIILCTMAITKMWRMDHLLTVLSLIPMVLLFATATIVGKSMTQKWDYRQECFSNMSDFAQESFSGIAVIKAFVKETKELLAFEKLNKESEVSNIDYTKVTVLLRILVTTFVESVICVILGYGGYLVYKGEFNAGQLMEFIGYFNAVIWPIMAVAELIDMTSRGKASLQRISELLDAPKNVYDRPDVKALENPKGDIAFRDLSFTYPDGEFPALEHISFEI